MASLWRGQRPQRSVVNIELSESQSSGTLDDVNFLCSLADIFHYLEGNNEKQNRQNAKTVSGLWCL